MTQRPDTKGRLDGSLNLAVGFFGGVGEGHLVFLRTKARHRLLLGALSSVSVASSGLQIHILPRGN